MEKLYADIIIDIAHEKLDRPFQYRIPETLRETITEGQCVHVPFGAGNTLRKGYVVAIKDTPDWDVEKIKEIMSVAPGGVSIEEKQIRLAAFLKRNYGSTMIQAMKTVLPAKQSVRALEKKTVRLILEKEQAEETLDFCRMKHQTAKARLLEELLQFSCLPYPLITGKLHVSPQTIKTMEKQGMLVVEKESHYRNPVRLQVGNAERKTLSEEQQQIVDRLLKDFDGGKKGTYLLHGITGSGKTEVYMQLIEEILNRGCQAIVLIPEIALTYQTLMRFYSRFGDRVSVLNSTLSAGEKYDQCERAKKGEIQVIIGPRSALFTPFPNIGLIIIDEEHESSYKSENSPKYHARETAQEVARMHGASLLLGSATPSLEAYYRAKQEEYTLFTLERRLTGGTLPAVSVVDLREELRAGNRSIFSRKLQELMSDRLKKKQQIMLFLNRRGYAGFISCRACGHVMKCPHCDVSLSEHRGGRLICHYCGYEQPAVHICPECGSKYISGFRAGTQQIEEKLKELYPEARVLRMDADTTKTKDSYEQILSAFASGEADVLIGTQMIVKGHDFPNVTLVGVLAADLSLSVGDYRSGERTFALLTQAVGRAGRGILPGEAVIQTYQPEHYSVTHAAAQDYEGFYEEEILYRELLRYPPVCNMLAVQIFAGEEKRGEALAQELAALAKSFIDMSEDQQKRLMVIGPAPAAIGKIHDIFRFVFYIKYEKYDRLVEVKDILEEKAATLFSSSEMLQIDFNPVNTF
ncbi:MAG: primosomal protein N' [Lachnospiraceae bacterium]|nr:primosomal protein N' [Lachnospiraceae bacterium]